MIKEVLVVEGRSDVARIRASHIDVDMITTDGFNLKPHTLEQIRCAYEKRGIIILTDPDRAGEQIHRFWPTASYYQTRLYPQERCHCQQRPGRRTGLAGSHPPGLVQSPLCDV